MSRTNQVRGAAHAITRDVIIRLQRVEPASDPFWVASTQQAFEDRIIPHLHVLDFNAVQLMITYARDGSIADPLEAPATKSLENRAAYAAHNIAVALCRLSRDVGSTIEIDAVKEPYKAFEDAIAQALHKLYPRSAVYFLQYHRTGKLNPELESPPNPVKTNRGKYPRKKKNE